jgi:hypothetical protein
MSVPRGAHVEITFQYNSLIRFDAHALAGLRLDANATLVFNFPYTTQVLFMAKCFEGVTMRDTSSKLVIRILKSFSVRFGGDFAHYLHQAHYKQPVNATTNQRTEIPRWSLSNGQFIIDIKSTHLVKFDEHSFSHLSLKSNARLFIDLELIEKFMLQRHAFAKLEASGASSRAVLFAKQITFIDFKAYSFADMTLRDTARVEIYLEELTSSLCLQRHVFTNMRLDGASSFNFSVINSKNVQLMHHAFANAQLNDNSNVFVGAFNMPSFVLLFQNDRFFKSFLLERLKYLNLPVAAVAGVIGHSHHHHHQPLLAAHMHHNNHLHSQYAGLYVSQPFPANSEYFYANLNSNSNSGFDDSVVYTMESEVFNARSLDIAKFYANNKQVYSYNFSVEKNCFHNLTTAGSSSSNSAVVSLVADNVHTMFLDDLVFNKSKQSGVNFELNLKHFVLSKNAISYLGRVGINFLKEPRVFKFGLASAAAAGFSNNDQQKRVISISGLSLVNSTNPSIVDFDYTYSDYFADNGGSSESESSSRAGGQRAVGKATGGKKDQRGSAEVQVNAFIDDFCQFKSIGLKDTMIRVFPRRSKDNENEQLPCSCQIVYLLQNQLRGFTNLRDLTAARVLPCKLNSFEFVDACMKQLDVKCETSDDQNRDAKFLKGYIKFWEYCISEQEPLVKGSYMTLANADAENNLLLNGLQEGGGVGGSGSGIYNFNDMDSLSSSLLDPTIDSHFKSSLYDPLSAGMADGSESPALSGNEEDENGLSSAADGDDSGGAAAGVPSSVGKIVGIVVICAVVGIVLFMVAVNIIQYKFRNDLFDDYECSSQNITSSAMVGGGPGSGNANRSSVSASGSGRNCKLNVSARGGGNCTNDDYNDYDSRNDKNDDEDDDDLGPVGVECEKIQGE